MIVPRARLAEIEADCQAGRSARSSSAIRCRRATTHGAIANRAQFDRIQTMIDVGISRRRQAPHRRTGSCDGLNVGFYAKSDHLFRRADRSMRIAQEEIFGPVLCIIPYDTVEEAVDHRQ